MTLNETMYTKRQTMSSTVDDLNYPKLCQIT